MQVGRALLYIAEATRRVKIEPEDDTPVRVRRVGFIQGTTDLAFGEFVPYLSSAEGLQLHRESMAGSSTESLVPSVAMATQTDSGISVDDLMGRFAAQSMGGQALPPSTYDVDYGGSPSMVASSHAGSDVANLAEFTRYHDSDDSNGTFDTAG